MLQPTQEKTGVGVPASTLFWAPPSFLGIGADTSVVSTAIRKQPPAVIASNAAAKSNDRKFKRWSKDEDRILVHAVENDRGPPHNWKLISAKHFKGSRTAHQVREPTLHCSFRGPRSMLSFTQPLLCVMFVHLTVQVSLEEQIVAAHQP